MKVAGIIAEYNPFHNGHLYHIERTRALTGADYIIAVISGNFVQRGAPALLDQFARAEMALRNGADLVIALPAACSTSGAGDFAKSGVSILSGLGVVTDLSFGCEATSGEEEKLLREAASFLSDEPVRFQTLFREGLRSGLSWPAARAGALARCLSHDPAVQAELSRLIASPNNILALEYLQALSRLNHPMSACMVKRSGDAYHHQYLSADSLPSATALRRALLGGESCPEHMPASVLQVISDYCAGHRFLTEDAFSGLLFGILCRERDRLPQRFSQQPALAATILRRLEHYRSWQDFVLQCKGKHLTYTAVSRFFVQILLGIDADTLCTVQKCGYAPYARVLGFQRAAAPLLSAIRENAAIPVIAAPAKAYRQLPCDIRRLLSLDLSSGDLYRYCSATIPCDTLSDLRHPLIYL